MTLRYRVLVGFTDMVLDTEYDDEGEPIPNEYNVFDKFEDAIACCKQYLAESRWDDSHVWEVNKSFRFNTRPNDLLTIIVDKSTN